MKKQVIFWGTMAMSAMLCGCGAKVQDLTDSEKVIITEYATNLLVKYSTVSERSLLSEEELEVGIAEEEKEKDRLLKVKELQNMYLNGTEETTKEKNEEESSQDGAGMAEAITGTQLSVNDFFDASDFSIDYSSYTLCHSYPEAGSEEFFMAMDATAGKQLCIVKFNVSNLSSSEQKLDMYAKRGRFSLKLDDGSTVSAQSTLLLDDLSSYVGTIAAGGTEEMVLVFEVPDTISQMGSMQLLMYNQDGENTIVLQ